MPLHIEKDIVLRLQLAQTHVEKFLEENLNGSRPKELSVARLLMLLRMNEGDTLAAKKFHEKTFVGSNANYNLSWLCKNGYLQKVTGPTDRRSVAITLTPKGLEVLEKNKLALAKLEATIGHCFSSENFELLVSVMI